MTWLKIDDGFSLHTKARAAGKDGRALWHVAAEGCARENLDGAVPKHMLAMYAALAEVPARKATTLLVASGLWHTHDALCDRCVDRRHEHATILEGEGRVLTPLAPGDHYFHDWCDYQLNKDGKDDPIARKRETRHRQLYRTEAGKRIIAAVRERDRDLCRYCGVLTIWVVGPGGDQRSSDAGNRGTIDHVDPFDWTNSVANCVTSCRRCNGRKRNRTPDQWVEDGGRPLLPEKWWETTPEPSADHSHADGPDEIDHERDQAPDHPPASRGAQDGPGQWSGRGPDEVPEVIDPDAESKPHPETTETGDDHG